jgi:protein-tyrosine phosphatase
LHALVADPENKILIHCKDGSNRAPSTAVACLMALGAPLEHAVEHVQEARPEAKMRYNNDAVKAIKALGYK